MATESRIPFNKFPKSLQAQLLGLAFNVNFNQVNVALPLGRISPALQLNSNGKLKFSAGDSRFLGSVDYGLRSGAVGLELGNPTLGFSGNVNPKGNCTFRLRYGASGPPLSDKIEMVSKSAGNPGNMQNLSNNLSIYTNAVNTYNQLYQSGKDTSAFGASMEVGYNASTGILTIYFSAQVRFEFL